MFAAVSLSGNRKPALGHNKRSSVPEDIPIRLAVTFASSRARVLQGERKLRDFYIARLQDIYCTVYFKTSGYSSLFWIFLFDKENDRLLKFGGCIFVHFILILEQELDSSIVFPLMIQM